MGKIWRAGREGSRTWGAERAGYGNGQSGWRCWRWLRRVCLAGYSYIYPMAAGAEKTVYASYTAQTGDIATTMSFNAQISAIHTETLQNSGEATVSNIYVTQDQAVKAGDKILDLSNGEPSRRASTAP